MQRPAIRRSPTVSACLSTILVCGASVGAPTVAAAQAPFKDQGSGKAEGASKVRPGMVVGVEPEIITILLRQPKPANPAGVLERVELQGEVTDERTATEYGWRSMQMTLDISCRSREGHVLSMNVFDEHGASGAPRAIVPPQSWIRLSQHTDESGAIDALCDRWANSAGISRKASRAAALAQPPSPPDDSPEPGPATTPQPQTTSAPPPLKTTRSAGQSVQLASTTSESSAADLLKKLKAQHPQSFSDVQTRLETAKVAGSVRYRVIVYGFQTSASARTFCSEIKSTGGCLIRSSD